MKTKPEISVSEQQRAPKSSPTGLACGLGTMVHCVLAHAIAAILEVALVVGDVLAAALGNALASALGSVVVAALGSELNAALGNTLGCILGSFDGRISLHTQICSLLIPHLDALEQLSEFSSTAQSLAP